MRVMTFNLKANYLLDRHNKWSERDQLVYDVIEKYGCDMIGLQEVTNQMEGDLKKHIKMYHHIGVSRTKNFFMERNTVLLKKKYKVLDSKTFWLSKKPHKKGSSMWHSLFPRICTRVVCQDEYQRKFVIYNTHLDCLSPVARRYGLRVILSDMSHLRQKEKMPCILTGDFNAKPNSKVIKQFKEEAYKLNGLKAAQDIKPEIYNQATMGYFKGKDRGLHIDYIFASEEFEICNIEIIKYNKDGKYPSDHYPVMAELKLKNKEMRN